MTSKGNAEKARKPVKQKDKSLVERNAAGEASNSTSKIALRFQQRVLDIFRTSFSDCFNNSLSAYIQEVKHHLYERDFSKAFGSQELIQAYTLRWSPSRALAYLELLRNLPWLDDIFDDPSNGPDTELQGDTTISKNEGPQNIVCFGGGAGAEIVAFAGYLQNIATHNSKAMIALRLIDIANWAPVIERLCSSITATAPSLKHVTTDGTLSREPFVGSGRFSASFEQQDILSMEPEHLARVLERVTVVTLFFTLNELYSTSMSATTNFLLTMTYSVEPGTLLLVVDSPGSYSTVQVGNSMATSSEEKEKKYPMKWLIDHTLLEACNIGSSKNASGTRQWEKVVSNDSRWCRLPKDITYPLVLEDMRYQVHLYKRVE